MKKRVYVYIDGFNLYHAIDALGLPHLKWLDLWSLSEKLVRDSEQVSVVKYFSAYATWREHSYRKHERYVAALEFSGVVPIMGRFKEKPMRCKACGHCYKSHEEKETDVYIGAHLVADALRDRFDRAMIISADTDLIAAVLLARSEATEKQIDIVAPPNRMNRNSLARFEIARGKMKLSLFPREITLPDGRKIIRPKDYDPPND
jgi:uncharacterized LabA/DUF88 family protein